MAVATGIAPGDLLDADVGIFGEMVALLVERNK